MRPLVAALALSCLCLAGLGFAAPVPADKKPKPEEKETGPIVVDFSPLVGTKDPTITLYIHFESGRRLKDFQMETNWRIDGPEKAHKIAASIAATINDDSTQFGLGIEIEAVSGKPELLIKGCKGKGVLEVRCTAEGLPCENQPKIRRLKGDKKEDKKDKK